MYNKKEIKKKINFRAASSDSHNLHALRQGVNPQESSFEKIRFDSIERYYQEISCSGRPAGQSVAMDCYVIRLSRYLMDLIGEHDFAYDGESFQKDFYELCMNAITATDLIDEAGEDELLLINVKQTIHLLKTSGILLPEAGMARIAAGDHSDIRLYSELFDTFWNRTRWEDIFPSDPAAAKELKKNKNFMKDSLLLLKGKVRLDDVINNFFELTGFAQKNDLFFISFIDFYLISWLKNFGLINYEKNSRNRPVCIELTEYGKKILELVG